ncbi:MAG: TetR family transcriptional regulator [Spirochaetales bacterium]|nr:TetR family transcriptional regulator [Spirochaetales bacterium]
MAQILKEEIKDKIIKSAINNFYSSGYKFATMKEIAKDAAIPTGLIYSYFKNKEDLFSCIVNPALKCIDSIYQIEKGINAEENIFEIELPAIVNLLKQFHFEFVILLEKSEGSCFSNIKDELIQNIKDHLENLSFIQEKNIESFLLHIFSSNLIEGITEIAKYYKNEAWAEKILTMLLNYHFIGIKAIINSI